VSRFRSEPLGNCGREFRDRQIEEVRRDVNRGLDELSTEYAQLLAAVADLASGSQGISGWSELLTRAAEWYPTQGMARERLRSGKSTLARDLRAGYEVVRSFVQTD
jgi:hypothetical protein